MNFYIRQILTSHTLNGIAHASVRELLEPYRHDTVTSILVAGTLVLRGSNSPIDAIISTHDSQRASAEKPDRIIHNRLVIAVNPLSSSSSSSSSSCAFFLFFLYFFFLSASGAESGGGGRDRKSTERGERKRIREGGRGSESCEADLKFIHPSCAHGALHVSVRR